MLKSSHYLRVQEFATIKKKIIFKQKKIKYIFCGFVVFVFFLTTVHVIIDIGDKDW